MATRVKAHVRRRSGEPAPRPWLLYGVAAGLLLIALGSLGYWLFNYADWGFLNRWHNAVVASTSDAGLNVDEIYILGRQDLSHEQLLDKIQTDRGTPMLSVDAAAIQERILTLPPVHQAQVTRLWPNRLLVRITERVPVALWQKEQILFPIDREGVTLTYARAENFSNLPVLVGDEAPRLAAELLDALATYPELAAQVRGATYVSGRRWDLFLKTDMHIKLPDGDVRVGLKRLMQFADEHLIFGKPIAIVDLRLPDRVVVKPIPQAPAPDGNITPSKPQI